MFFVMLFTAVQALFAMYLGSTVDGVSYDAALIVAQSGSSSDSAARQRAVDHINTLLPGAKDLQVSFAGSTDEVVRLTITAQPPTFIGTAFEFPLMGKLSRTAEVRVERNVEPTP